MNTGILLITHQPIGKAFVDVAQSMLAKKTQSIQVIEIELECDLDITISQAEEAFKKADNGSGVLILTDAYGSTPSNIAMKLVCSFHAIAVSGLNLPMLIRVLNYSELPLEALSKKALSGGLDGVTIFNASGPTN